MTALIDRNVYFKHSRSGEIYEVLNFAEHSETHEKLVVYTKFKKHEYDSNTVWARPVDNFMDEVFCDGEYIPRFVAVHSIHEIFTEKEIEELISAKKCKDPSKIDRCVLKNLEWIEDMETEVE